MKNILKTVIFPLGLALSLFSCNLHEQKAEDSLKVMSFNVRQDNADDGVNRWDMRKDKAIEMLKEQQPDLLGLQEPFHHQLAYIKEKLPHYTALGLGRLGGKEGEYSALLFDKDRFELLKSGNFSLSEHPDSIGIYGWDAACERIATWAILKDRKKDRTLFFLNTHLDHMGQVARRESIGLIDKKIKELGGKDMPVIITGDFNAAPTDEPIKLMKKYNYLITGEVAKRKEGPKGTWHDYGKEKDCLLDYVFVSDDFDVFEYKVLTEPNNEYFWSDHHPIYSVIQFKK